MRALGGLAVVCVTRRDTLMQVLDGVVTVHVGRGPDRTVFKADWRADKEIDAFIYELNHGKFKEESMSNVALAA